MSNPYFNPSGVPATRAQLSSSAIRTVFTNIGAGFDKLAPALTANALLHVNAAGTQYAAHASITVSAAGAVAGITDLTTTGNTVLGNASTDTLNVGNGGLVKDSGGNVGIGRTPSGAAVLDVQNDSVGIVRVRGGTGAGQGSGFFATSGSDTTRFAAGQYSRIFGGTPGDDSAVYSAGALSLAAGGAVAATLGASGNMGVGTGSPAAKLHVAGSLRVDAATRTSVSAGGASAPPGAPAIYLVINVGGTDYGFAGYPL